VKDVEALKKLTNLIKYHHERYDGRGYPEGLKESQISIDTYIIALADAFDAMCSDRPYRKAMSKEQAVEIIKQERGKQFHPKVVDIFLDSISSVGGK
jgi:HD-GYP domain-containing protein (c-di-GMP phosphodiesterase class II)